MNDNLQLLERAYNLDLSDEQIKILTCGFKQPTLINSCAGAGKTTLLMLSIIYNALEHKTATDQVMGITFSKKAQMDMTERYQTFLAKIQPYVNEANFWEEPKLSTFHSLFYRMLNAFDTNGLSYEVCNWTEFLSKLYKSIQHPNESLSMRDDLERYMNLRSSLVNQGISLDGVTPNGKSPKAALILQNLDENGINAILHNFGYDADFTGDYINVIKTYNELKRQSHKIDFDDMQTMVLNMLLTNPTFKEVAQNYVAEFTQIYVDEFQDISFLQWEILTHLFSPEVLNHLVVIGDDDQSIYSFRGSNPQYILNFSSKLMPNAQVLNLSTNYRTGGNILKAVVPEITNNTQRLKKPLNAYHKAGSIRMIKRPQESLTVDDPILDEIIAEYHQSQSARDQQTFALLVRYNNDLAIASDYLAEHQIYVNLGPKSKDKLLQENRIYKIIFNLMKAFYDDDFNLFAENANYIGFSNYRRFVNQFANQYTKISDFVSNEQVDYSNWKLRQPQSKVADLVTTLSGLRDGQSEESQRLFLQVLFDGVDSLVSTYFNYVIQHRYVGYSQKDYDTIRSYIEHLAYNKDSFDTFNSTEVFKETKIMQASEHNEGLFEAMTLHTAKGLEFDHVILFGLSDRDLTEDTMELYAEFLPNITLEDFTEKILKPDNSLVLLSNLAKNNVTAVNRLAELAFTEKERKRVISQLFSLTSVQILRVSAMGGTLAQEAGEMISVLSSHPELIALMYHQVMTVAERVEEERRLLYVGVTRAKQSLSIDATQDNNSPLLDELDVAAEDASSNIE